MAKKMSRYQANKKILKVLKKLVERWPNWRFNQILLNADVTLEGKDMFFDESIETLDRMDHNDIVLGSQAMTDDLTPGEYK